MDAEEEVLDTEDAALYAEDIDEGGEQDIEELLMHGDEDDDSTDYCKYCQPHIQLLTLREPGPPRGRGAARRGRWVGRGRGGGVARAAPSPAPPPRAQERARRLRARSSLVA